MKATLLISAEKCVFNGFLRQYVSLYRAVVHIEGARRYLAPSETTMLYDANFLPWSNPINTFITTYME